MARFYFNITDGETMLDDEGMEFPDLDAVRHEAVQSSAEMLKDMEGRKFWTGEPWKLWVTDRPDGHGNVVLMLEFAAKYSS